MLLQDATLTQAMCRYTSRGLAWMHAEGRTRKSLHDEVGPSAVGVRVSEAVVGQ